jgi:uncharacterized membrane protein YphA (DoxX/SURF4 family)
MDLESPGRDLVDTEAPAHFARAKASTASTILLCVATLFTVLTYLEDAIRCITLWNEQLAFIAKHVGLPRSIAGTMLLFVAGVQLVSPIIIIPTAAVPRMAVPVMIVTCAIAFTVILQPILFNQLTNVELLTLSMAQLGACGIVFAEAHFVAYPRKSPFATHLASADQYKAAAIVPWIQLLSRVMLTVDLALVFGLRLSEVHPSSLSLSSPSPSLSLSLSLFLSLSRTRTHTHTHSHTLRLPRLQMFYSDDSGIVVGIASTTYILILLAGLMVWLGYKTQACACIIALAVFTDAFVRFPFWEGGRNADHKRFHFFQAMTPVGGLLLLVALGPGRFSVDAASKSK